MALTRSVAFVLLTGIAMITSGPLWADSATTEGSSQAEEPYLENVGRKVQRGLSNTAFGWAEIPAGIEEIGNKHGLGAAATWGVLHGTGRAIQRTAVGIFEILTAPLGLAQDFEPFRDKEEAVGGQDASPAPE